MASDPVTEQPEISALLVRAEERGCVTASELDAVTRELDLPEGDVESLHEVLEARGLEVSDDCARADSPQAVYTPAELVGHTTDALQLFLNEAGRYPLLTPVEELDLA